MSIFHFQETRYPSPGSGNFAYVSDQTLPPHAIQGGGNLVRGQMTIVTPHQAMNAMTLPTLPLAGFGGLVNGQMIQQGLIGHGE